MRARPSTPFALPVVSIFAVVVFAHVVVSPDGARADPNPGHWEELGEDGAIWVPAEAPAARYLPPPGLGAYHDHAETADALAALAAARPDVFTRTQVGATVEGRPVWMLTATGPGDDTSRPRVLFDGAHHGNEVIGSETLIRFLQAIHDRYDADPALRDILDGVVLDVVPMVNVDSVARAHQCAEYSVCRKNSRGVDLNRNYPDHWGGAGSSSSPSSATYRGPSPLSEPETQAIAALLDNPGYALHASFHSGTELILWPHGWTTAAPAEAALYEELGDELTALTGVANGQTAVILYQASGTTMDQAYGSAGRWRPISFSPEAYEGSGNAFDWWLLFNPAETEAAIGPVVARWLPMLWHLAEEAPGFRPALLAVADPFSVGPDVGTLAVGVTPASRRPLMSSSVGLDVGDVPVAVESSNPVPLAAGQPQYDVAFSLLPQQAGSHDARVTLDAGPAGTHAADFMLDLVQVGFGLALLDDVMGTPDQNQATATVSAGPFETVEGSVTFRLEPSGEAVGTLPFYAAPEAPSVRVVAFNATGLAAGVHAVVAEAHFVAVLDGVERPGLARAEATFVVERPEISLLKVFSPLSAALQPLPVLSIYRNRGNLPALDVVVTETVPLGYVYWFRQGPVPVPPDPLGAPMPEEVAVQPDGSVDVTWRLGDIGPGVQKGIRYRVLPWLPGESALAAAWDYVGAFGPVDVQYHDEAHPPHVTV